MEFSTLILLGKNLLSPTVLSFVLGILAVLVKSDLKIPDQIYALLSIYLLLAIGLKGGCALSQCSFSVILPSALMTLVLGIFLPLFSFCILRMAGYTRVDAAAMSAHFGSVSVITFMASTVFVENLGFSPAPHMTSLVAILEIPAIIIGILLARPQVSFLKEISFVVASKSVLLLLGGMVIGYLSGKEGLERIAPFFVNPFQGILVLFLLEMGLVAGHKLIRARVLSLKLVLCSIFIAFINGNVGVWVAMKILGMDVGSATVLGTMAASASYIAAPAAVRMALPQANAGLYLSAALVIVFPFNLSLGIPLYHSLALLWK